MGPWDGRRAEGGVAEEPVWVGGRPMHVGRAQGEVRKQRCRGKRKAVKRQYHLFFGTGDGAEGGVRSESKEKHQSAQRRPRRRMGRRSKEVEG